MREEREIGDVKILYVINYYYIKTYKIRIFLL